MFTNLEIQLFEIREGLLESLSSNVHSPVISMKSYKLTIELLEETDKLLKIIKNNRLRKRMTK